MKPHLEQPEAGYVGYQLPSFERWQEGYWAGNYPRLQASGAAGLPSGGCRGSPGQSMSRPLLPAPLPRPLRLCPQAIKANYDPLGIFSKPYTVQPAVVTADDGSSGGGKKAAPCKDELRR